MIGTKKRETLQAQMLTGTGKKFLDAHRVLPREGTPESVSNPSAKCPRCGKTTQVDMFRRIDEAAVPHDYVCDACWVLLRTRGEIG